MYPYTTWEGMRRFNAAVVRYAGVAALATRPADAILTPLFEDDRAVLRYHEYRFAMGEEMTYLWSVPSTFWSLLADALPAEATGIQLRSDTIRAAAVSCAYITRVLFGPFDSGPVFLSDWRQHRS